MKTFKTLLRNDIRLIVRDPFLLMMLGFSVVITLVLRWGLPWANEALMVNGLMPGKTISFPFSDVYPLVTAYMGIYTGPLIVGSMFGFVLLDERDQGTLLSLQVSPIPLEHYLYYRSLAPILLAWPITIGMTWGIGQAQTDWLGLICLSFMGSLTAPLITLFLAGFAENKTQGFALSKFVSIAGWAILFGFFFDPPLQWLFGIYPPFWMCKAYWLQLQGSIIWVAIGLGIVTHVLCYLYLLSKIKKVI